MNTSPTLVQDVFAQHLFTLISLEKKLVKVYLKMEKAAASAELSKALAPVSTDQDKHLERLKLIQISTSIPMEHQAVENIGIKTIALRLRKKSEAQDLAIISYALQLQSLKMGRYEFLHSMAVLQQLTQEAELLEQTLIDNRNTNTWLRQIVKNVVGPGLMAEAELI